MGKIAFSNTKRKLLLSFILLAVLFSGCQKAYPTPVYGAFGNERRTSYVDVAGLTEGDFQVAWKYEMVDSAEDPITKVYNSPVVDGRVMYLGGQGVYAVSLDTGQEIWRKEFNSILDPNAKYLSVYPPLVYRDSIFIVVSYYPDKWERERLVSLDKRTGDLLWQSDEFGKDPNRVGPFGFPIIVGDRIYLPANNTVETDPFHESGIWVFDTGTGKVLDKIFLESHPYHYALRANDTMLAAEGTTLYGIADILGKSYLFSYDTMEKQLKFNQLAFDFSGSWNRIAIGKDSIAVCLAKDSIPPAFSIKVFEKSTLRVLWEKESSQPEGIGIPIMSYIALHQDRLYTVLFEGRFVCFDLRTGKELWSYSPPFKEVKVPMEGAEGIKEKTYKWFGVDDILIARDVVYFNGRDTVYAFHPETGQLLWQKDIYQDARVRNIMPVEKGLIVHYTYDKNFPSPPVFELWREK